MMAKVSLLKAHGIPDRSNMGDLRALPESKDATFLIQEHNARKAGHHFDIRLGTENTRLFSWATRKDLPQPGAKPILLYQQPLHAYGYKDFEGEVRSRYGAGTVRKKEEGKALILQKSPGKIKFVLTHRGDPETFTLLKTKDQAKNSWLLFNTTPSKPLEYEKEKYELVRPNEIRKLIKDPDYVMTPKIDGAAALVRLLKNKADVYSYRTSVKGLPITHTHRIEGLSGLEIPKEFQGSLLRGEIWASKDGKAIPTQQLGGLLNSSVDKSLTKQRAENIRMHVALFGQIPEGKSPLFNVPEEKRQRAVKKLLEYLPRHIFHSLPVARTEQEKQDLWARIRKGEHPWTQEGVVAHHVKGGVPIKSKLVKDHDVYIRGIFEGEGKYKGNSAGGFEYSFEPFGKVVGKVGIGISDEIRKDMWENKSKYIGRVAKVSAQDKFPSGALRVPTFLGLHEDYTQKKAEVDLPFESLPARYAKYYDATDKAHASEHIRKVREAAAMLAAKHAPQHAKLVDMAAALHDIGRASDPEHHESVGASIISKDRELRQTLGDRNFKILVEAVRQHRASSGKPRSIVAKILSDADRMEGGSPQEMLQRLINYRKTHFPESTEEQSLLDSLQHVQKKYSPGSYGRRVYFPETEQQLASKVDPILAAKKAKDPVQHLRNILYSGDKKAMEKEAASDIPAAAYIGSILGGLGLGMLGTHLQGRSLLKTLNETPRVTEKQIDRIYDSLNIPRQLQIAKMPGSQNAYYFSPLSKYEAENDPTVQLLIERNKLNRKNLRTHGLIAYDPAFAKAGIIGHEAGHAGIRLTRPWYSPSRINQSVLTSLGSLFNHYTPALGAVAGLMSGKEMPLIGPAVGGGLGLLTGLPTLINEYQASNAAKKWMEDDPYMRGETMLKNRKALNKAWRTYLYSSVLPGLAAGGIGAGLSNLS